MGVIIKIWKLAVQIAVVFLQSARLAAPLKNVLTADWNLVAVGRNCIRMEGPTRSGASYGEATEVMVGC